MSAGMCLLPMHAFMVSTGNNLRLHDSIPTLKNLVENRNSLSAYELKIKIL